jgi:hypothetical protein
LRGLHNDEETPDEESGHDEEQEEVQEIPPPPSQPATRRDKAKSKFNTRYKTLERSDKQVQGTSTRYSI